MPQIILDLTQKQFTRLQKAVAREFEIFDEFDKYKDVTEEEIAEQLMNIVADITTRQERKEKIKTVDAQREEF